jgi:hypothetical protein
MPPETHDSIDSLSTLYNTDLGSDRMKFGDGELLRNLDEGIVGAVVHMGTQTPEDAIATAVEHLQSHGEGPLRFIAFEGDWGRAKGWVSENSSSLDKIGVLYLQSGKLGEVDAFPGRGEKVCPYCGYLNGLHNCPKCPLCVGSQT